MGERIRQKSTWKCIETVSDMKCLGLCLELDLYLDDSATCGDLWTWKLTAVDGSDGEYFFTVESVVTYSYQDEAANAGYRHAYKHYRKGA